MRGKLNYHFSFLPKFFLYVAFVNDNKVEKQLRRNTIGWRMDDAIVSIMVDYLWIC